MGEQTSKHTQRMKPGEPVKSKTIIVVPNQHHDDIEQRRRIREAFHDSQSRIIKGRGDR
jgi:hypothetical protein